jgi:pimeloyl-[acyl-carrier protein] synthase
MRSRASKTLTRIPPSTSFRAQQSPLTPAPITTISGRIILPFARLRRVHSWGQIPVRTEITVVTVLAFPADIAHPFSPAGSIDPHAAYHWLRANAPAYHDRLSGFWLITDHAGCSRVLKDPRFSAELGQGLRERDRDLPASMLTTDPPDHARLRAAGSLIAGPAVLAADEPGFAAETDRLVASLPEHGTVDVVAALGEPLALAALCRLLRIPDESRSVFLPLARAVSVNLDPMSGAAAALAGRMAGGELTRWFDALADAQPPGTALARLAADPRLSRAEYLSLLSLLVVGGFRPLAEFTGNAIGLLSGHPEAVAALAAGTDPRPIVDELLRLEPPIPFTARVTREEVELGGTTIPAGARVLAVLSAASRDPEIFADPDRLDPRRSPSRHLAFGAGPHFCLAAGLVRLCAGLLLTGLYQRFALEPVAPGPRWAPGFMPRRLDGFQVRLDGHRTR